MHILDFSKTTTLDNRSADILVRSRSSVTPLSGQECPMPLGIEARSHACQRHFGWQRQSGGPVPPHPGPLPGGEGELSAAGRQIEASRQLARRPTEHPLLGERAGVRGNGAYAVYTGRSSEPDTLQTRSQFLTALDRRSAPHRNGYRWSATRSAPISGRSTLWRRAQRAYFENFLFAR